MGRHPPLGHMCLGSCCVPELCPKLCTGDRHISYLPLAHIYERVTMVTATHFGCAVRDACAAPPVWSQHADQIRMLSWVTMLVGSSKGCTAKMLHRLASTVAMSCCCWRTSRSCSPRCSPRCRACTTASMTRSGTQCSGPCATLMDMLHRCRQAAKHRKLQAHDVSTISRCRSWARSHRAAQ
jgi:hypothetical protein